MTHFNRRSLLKSLVIGSALPFLNSEFLSALQDNKSYTYIILHGLFFLEFQSDRLVVVTPQYKHHEFITIRQDSAKQERMPEYVVLDGILAPGKVDNLKPWMLQYKPSVVKPNGYVLDAEDPITYKDRCTMNLPHPDDIIPCGWSDLNDFVPKAGSKIGAQIKSSSGIPDPQSGEKKVAVTTILRYEVAKGAPYVVSYFAQHKGMPSVHDVNGALKAAKHPCGNEFDLQMEKLGKPVPCKQKELPQGIKVEDTYSLGQRFNPQLVNVDIASCPQFGIGHG